MSFLDEAPTSAPAGGAVSVARWPGYVAAGAALCAAFLLGVGLFLSSSSIWPFVVGYGLGAVVGPAMAVAHRYSSESSRKSPWFVRSRTTTRVIGVAVVAGLFLGVAHAWFLATELAKV